MRTVHVVFHRVGVVGEALLQLLVARLTFGYALDKSGNLLMLLVLPWVGFSPVVVEVTLHHFHLLYGSLFGIFLHASVDGGVYLQS